MDEKIQQLIAVYNHQFALEEGTVQTIDNRPKTIDHRPEIEDGKESFVASQMTPVATPSFQTAPPTYIEQLLKEYLLSKGFEHNTAAYIKELQTSAKEWILSMDFDLFENYHRIRIFAVDKNKNKNKSLLWFSFYNNKAKQFSLTIDDRVLIEEARFEENPLRGFAYSVNKAGEITEVTFVLPENVLSYDKMHYSTHLQVISPSQAVEKCKEFRRALLSKQLKALSFETPVKSFEIENGFIAAYPGAVYDGEDEFVIKNIDTEEIHLHKKLGNNTSFINQNFEVVRFDDRNEGFVFGGATLEGKLLFHLQSQNGAVRRVSGELIVGIEKNTLCAFDTENNMQKKKIKAFKGKRRVS